MLKTTQLKSHIRFWHKST